MNAALQRTWTREQFFTWAEAQEGRYEFNGVRPVGMTGGTLNHSLIVGNIIGGLNARLGDGPCRALGPDAGVETVGEAVRYPDALVTCSPFDGRARVTPGVVIVFEVISHSSGRVDRIDKPREYACVPSIRRYVIVESVAVGLTVWSREDGGEPWRAETVAEGETLRLPEVGLDIPVAEIYRRVEFTPAV